MDRVQLIRLINPSVRDEMLTGFIPQTAIQLTPVIYDEIFNYLSVRNNSNNFF